MGHGDDWGANFAGTSMAAYEDALVGPVFTPWGKHLLDRLDVGAGEALLDVACGPGTVARLAADRTRGGTVVGCDLSEEMLSIARAKGAVAGVAIDYRQCPAEVLAVDDHAFDVAVCQQGLQFFGDRIKALEELRRALRVGGRVGVSVWCEIESCEPFAALADAIGEVLGSDVADAYRAGPWGRCDAEELADEVRAAGFVGIEVSRDVIRVVFDDVDHLIRTLGAAPVGASVSALDAGGRRALRTALQRSSESLAGSTGISGIMTAHTATAAA